jgi:hypothetical protein
MRGDILSRKNILIVLLVCSFSLTFIGTVSAQWYTVDIPMNYQEDPNWWCGPASLQMIGLSWGISVSQSDLASYAGTQSNPTGTTHYGLMSAANHFFGTSYDEWYWSNVEVGGSTKNNLLSGKRYIIHIMTGTLKTDAYGNPLWVNDYGHYIVLSGLNPDERQDVGGLIRVNDPIKGVKDLTYNQLKEATGRVSNQKSVLKFSR